MKIFAIIFPTKRALILRDEGMAIGIMGFSVKTGNIDFWAVHPKYRGLGIEKIFLDKLADGLLCGKEISLTTYRKGDKADTGYRDEYLPSWICGKRTVDGVWLSNAAFCASPKR